MMKRILICTLSLVLFLAFVLCFHLEAADTNPITQMHSFKRIDGTWKLKMYQYSDSEAISAVNLVQPYKIFSNGTFIVIRLNTKTNEVIRSLGGSYTIIDDVMTENITFASSGFNAFNNQSFVYEINVDDNKFTQKSLENSGLNINEEWVRCDENEFQPKTNDEEK